MKEFCDFVRHRDLKRIKTSDGYDWIDHLIGKKIPRDSIRKVWLAALSATASFQVERRKLDQNPFLGIRVRDEDASEDAEKEEQQKEPPRKGFTPQEAKRILTATLVAPSDFISVEMAAARRWLPWLCAYSGARVNELLPLRGVRDEARTGRPMRPDGAPGRALRTGDDEGPRAQQHFPGDDRVRTLRRSPDVR